MIDYFLHDNWKIIEKGFDSKMNRASESVFSIGNGRMGQRANFEESYSGDSLQGSYLAGVYFPDKTRVGWWKNGYPEYFAKVINSVNWIGIRIMVNGKELDIHDCKIYDFYRELDMKSGLLRRECTMKLKSGEKVKIKSIRFCSMERKDIGAVQYRIEALNFSGEISLIPYLDFDVINEDSNYEEKFWQETDKDSNSDFPYVEAKTKKLDFRVRATMHYEISKMGESLQLSVLPSERKKFIAQQTNISVKEGEVVQINKYAAIISNFNYPDEDFKSLSKDLLKKATEAGFEKLMEEHVSVWHGMWDKHDIQIEGDVAAQQGIRFNIFHLHQTYTGEDPRLNIGPKGFTGEKYGGSTYWDTEAYCLPFYLCSADPEVARNLVKYRYNHLPKAIENAEKLGFSNGAALYPMVTMNGEECHNEWEITFEEIHRNTAIAYAIFDYVRYTDDVEYLPKYGLEVLIAISRFWSQRITFSEHKSQYVMLGVTGPNEYENNINNNWYTNYGALWCFRYTQEIIDLVKKEFPEHYKDICKKTKFDEKEIERWQDIQSRMYMPFDESKNVFLQQEGFLDKEMIPASELPKEQRPINQHWSWDRILRSVYIKQADTLQGFYFFEHEFSKEELKRHFDFYEPYTVHESSLSPCVHVIQAAALNRPQKAYELYLRTSRLDLDDYNNEVAEGLHITSMAGTWMSVVKGFGGMRVEEGKLIFNPLLPDQWESCKFNVFFRSANIEIFFDKQKVVVKNLEGNTVPIIVYEKATELAENQTFEIDYLKHS